MPPVKTSQNGLGSDLLHLIFCHSFPIWHSMELQEVEKREVPEESKDECGLMPSSLQGSSDSHQPYSDDKFKFNELEVDLGQDGACGCSHAKEDEIPTKISGSPHIISPHKLCRPKKVVSGDRLHRHISVETRKKGLFWNTDIRWVRELAFFLLLQACLSSWPQCQAFDPDYLWQLSTTSAGNPQEGSVRTSLKPVYSSLQWSNFCKCSWPLHKWWQTCLFIRRGDFQVLFYCSQPQSPFSRCWQVLAKMLSDTKTETTVPLPCLDVSMKQGWALAVPPASNAMVSV